MTCAQGAGHPNAKKQGRNGFCALKGKGHGQEAGDKTWGPSKVGSQTSHNDNLSG